MLIDANLISVFFNKDNNRHEVYRPVLNWFITGRAKIIIGGGHYKNELSRQRKFLPIIQELRRFNKTHSFFDGDVENLTAIIQSQETSGDLDDPHIIALLVISQAKLFCSEDKRLDKFLVNKKFYPGNQEPPKILRLSELERSSLNLLVDDNICSQGEHIALPESTAKQFLQKWGYK
jgi:hypothetical protein